VQEVSIERQRIRDARPVLTGIFVIPDTFNGNHCCSAAPFGCLTSITQLSFKLQAAFVILCIRPYCEITTNQEQIHNFIFRKAAKLKLKLNKIQY